MYDVVSVKIPSCTAVRGEVDVASEWKYVGVPNFH